MLLEFNFYKIYSLNLTSAVLLSRGRLRCSLLLHAALDDCLFSSCNDDSGNVGNTLIFWRGSFAVGGNFDVVFLNHLLHEINQNIVQGLRVQWIFRWRNGVHDSLI